jgi:hypothetical protein
MDQVSYRRHRFPQPIIQHAIWLYLRFTLSYRDVKAGIGVAIMPESIVRQEVDILISVSEARELASIKIQDCQLTMQIDWVFLEDRAESRVLQALLSIA